MIKVRSIWAAIRQAITSRAKPGNSMITLEAKQIEALVQLYANMLGRHHDLETHLSDLAGPLTLLLRSGADWQWYPEWELTFDSQRLEAWIRADFTKHSANYEIISREQDLQWEQAGIQLLTPGIRMKESKQPLYKARIALHRLSRPEETAQLLDDLSEL